MRNERHNCGGILRKKQVAITKNFGGLLFTFTVEGKQCNSCSEEVISRNTLRELEVLPVKIEHVNRRKMGTLSTLAIPIINVSTTGSLPDGIRVSPTEDTSLLAHV